MNASTGTVARGDGVVTVLFTDVVGSTELLGLLGEEAMEACRREHFVLLRQALAAHRGREVKNVGDGLMVVFGSEAAGLRCAVAMQASAAGQVLPGGRHLRLRIGIHCGPTIEAEDDHWGTTVVVARRLCDIAQAHEILTSEVLVERAGGGQRARGLGPVALRGLADPVAVCALQWDGAPRKPPRPAQPLHIELPPALRARGPVVGRERELATLEALVRGAAGSERSLLLVAGEPGIGKTTLVGELARRAHARGSVVLAGHCDEGFAAPFQPAAEALRQLVAALAPARLRAQLGGWAPDLARLLPELAHPPLGAVPRHSSDPDTDQHLMFQAVSHLLAASAREATVLLVLEDLHWADAATVALLRHVAAGPAAAIAIVATLRDGELEPGHPLREDAAQPLERVLLRGLDEAAVGELVGAGGDAAAAPEVARAVHGLAGGNPLHAAELARAWREAGSLVVRDRELVLAGGSPAPGASSLRGVVEQRVGGLPADTRRVLTLGSVLGQSFATERVTEILAADEPAELARVLGRAAREEMLVRDGGGQRYGFSHALLRQALYARTPVARRARLHRQVADAIEDTKDTAGAERVSELAYHFAHCARLGRAEKAVEYALRAGRVSLDLLAHDRAAAHFARALELLETEDVAGAAPMRCDATIGLGECQARAGDASYRQTLLDGARQAERLGDGERLARAALANGRGFFSTAGAVDEERVATLRAALAALDERDSDTRARLLAQLAMELSHAGDWDARLALSDAALAMARRLGDPVTHVTVLYQRCVTLWGVHGLERRCAASEEAEPQLGWLADPMLAFHASHQGVHVALAVGDLDLADRRLGAMREHAGATGQPTLAWYERVAESKRALLGGRVREAQALAFAARDVGVATGQADAWLWWQGQMFCLRYVQGRLADTDYSALPALAAHHPRLSPLYDAQLACMQAAHGREDDARETLARLTASGLEDLPIDFAWICTVALAGHACWQLADAQRAALVSATLAPWAEHLADMGPSSLGSTSHFLALLAVTRGRPDEADEHFARAASMHRRLPAFAALTDVAWAECQLAGHVAGGGRPDAATLAERALRSGRELVLPGVERRAAAVLAGLRARPG